MGAGAASSDLRIWREILAGMVGGSPACEMSLDVTANLVTMNLVMSEAVEFFRILADGTRWRIVRLVMDRALCVCELAEILEMPQSSVSSHVQIIRRADLLESETCGKWTYFRIRRAHLAVLKNILRHFPNAGEFASDEQKAEARLARRETSCCPGPAKLTTARKSTPSRKS